MTSDSFVFKAQKNIATKISKTKNGETIVQNAIGKENFHTFNTFCKIIEKIKKQDEIKKWRKSIFKFAFKFQILIKNEKVSVEDLKIFQKDYKTILEIILKLIASIKLRKNGEELIDQYIEAKTQFIEKITKFLNDKMTTKNKNLLKKAIFLLSKKDFEKMSNIIEPEEIEEIETTFKNLSYILTEVKFEPKRPRFEFCDKYNSAICSSQMIWKKLLKNEDKTVIGKMIIFKYKTRNNLMIEENEKTANKIVVNFTRIMSGLNYPEVHEKSIDLLRKMIVEMENKGDEGKLEIKKLAVNLIEAVCETIEEVLCGDLKTLEKSKFRAVWNIMIKLYL